MEEFIRHKDAEDYVLCQYAKLDNRVKAVINDVLLDHTNMLMGWMRRAESPIEQLLTIALVDDLKGFQALVDMGYIKAWRVLPQEPIKTPHGNYRVDFLVTITMPDESVLRLVVECDGHDYHERTKEQAARDKSRDRALTEIGIRVLRFTGSEIWRDPWECAEQVVRVAESMIYEKERQ